MHRSTFGIIGLVVLTLGGCSGQSCSRLAPIPGGFPAAQRTPNATQVRLSQSGVAALVAEPRVVATALLGSLSANVPSSCGGSPEVCCSAGSPVSPCGPLVFDVDARPGDPPRLVLTPAAGASRVDVTLRARVKASSDVPLNLPIVGACALHLDTAPGANPDIVLQFPLSFVQDATAGTTRWEIGSLSVSQFTTDDFSLVGGFACAAANFSANLAQGTVVATIEDQIRNSLQQSLCKACPSGSVSECGTFATACTAQVCMIGNACQQELGFDGRLVAGKLFGGTPPASLGSLDLYEVAGGYATTNSSGVALGILAGMIPSGATRDRCGPAASPPASVTIPQSAYFQGNTRPDTGQPFHAAIGLHASELERFFYAAYDGGVLCPTVGTSELPTFGSATFDASLPSLRNLTGGNRHVAVGIRPQAPPAIALGANTFDAGGAVFDPLIALAFAGMEIDLFASVEDQPIRVLTLVANVQVPLGAQIDAGGNVVLVPGAATATSVSVKSSEPLQETGATLTAVTQALLDHALPELVRRVGPLGLPSVLGMVMHPTAVTTVDNNDFVALFSDLEAPALAPGPNLVPNVRAPTSASGLSERHPRSARPAGRAHSAATVGAFDGLRLALAMALAVLAFGFARRRSLRWALPASAVATVLAAPVGCGDGESSGNAPGVGTDGSVGGQSGGAGGESGGAGAGQSGGGQGGNARGGAGGAGGSSGSGGGAGANAGGSSGSGGSSGGTDGGLGGAGGVGGSPCGASACLSGDVTHGELGQWNSVDVGARTVVTSYDALLGDLVLVDYASDVETRRVVVDGVPVEIPTHDPAGYRGGVEQPGPNVGAWSSVRLSGSRVVVAYQDRDRGALRVAFEDASGVFHSHDVDDSTVAGVVIGAYASLTLGTRPAIAYLATGVPGSGTMTELRLATASSASPSATTDWTTKVVDSAVDSPPAVPDIPNGPGLFVNLIALGDGRRVLVHYDRPQRSLVAHVESAAGSGTFSRTVLDGGAGLDRGKWASAVAEASGKIHVAYEDSLGHQVFYLTFTPGGAIGSPELVDDGTRTADRPHPVGAGLALWLDTVPRVAYQDAATANVVVATRNTSWSHLDQTTGSALGGFHIAAPQLGSGPLAWDQMDSAKAASHHLVVVSAP